MSAVGAILVEYLNIPWQCAPLEECPGPRPCPPPQGIARPIPISQPLQLWLIRLQVQVLPAAQNARDNHKFCQGSICRSGAGPPRRYRRGRRGVINFWELRRGRRPPFCGRLHRGGTTPPSPQTRLSASHYRRQAFSASPDRGQANRAPARHQRGPRRALSPP